MESRPKRKNLRRNSRLILLLAVVFLTGSCAAEKKQILSESVPKPKILLLPIMARGSGLPDMMDVTETFIYFIKAGNKYVPKDVGESLAVVRQFQLSGIYPQQSKIQQIGIQQKVDFVLIGQVNRGGTDQNPLGLLSMPSSTIEVKLRLFNAKTGMLKQIIHYQKNVSDSIRGTLNLILAESIAKL